MSGVGVFRILERVNNERINNWVEVVFSLTKCEWSTRFLNIGEGKIFLP